jgi:hypothetical protein
MTLQIAHPDATTLDVRFADEQTPTRTKTKSRCAA